MDALSTTPLGSTALGATTLLRPRVGNGATNATNLAIQDLALGLVQQSLGTVALGPNAEGTLDPFGLDRVATASLLASLRAPQAATTANPAPETATPPAAPLPVDSTPSTAPAATPALPPLDQSPVSQDAFATSSSPDFASLAALRFGSGVAGTSALAAPLASANQALVRDAGSVVRVGGLQSQAGGPGPEAFLRSPPQMARAMHDYQAGSPVPQSTSLDLEA